MPPSGVFGIPSRSPCSDSAPPAASVVDVTVTAWVALVAGLVALLLLDLFVLHRGAHEISIRDELARAVAERTASAHLADKLRESWGALLKPAAFRGDLCFAPSQGRHVRFVRPREWLGAWDAAHGRRRSPGGAALSP